MPSLAGVAAIALAAAGVAAHEEQPRKAGSARAAPEQKPWGIAGNRTSAARTIAVGMGDDMRFSPQVIEVRRGETVRFQLTNKGAAMHEFVIGTKTELDEHAALMAKFPGMQHDEPWMAHVKPGRKGELVWHFNREGEFDFACLVAGHYQAGMAGKIIVRP